MIKPKINTTTKGTEAVRRFTAELKLLKSGYVTIGLHEDAGQYQSGVSVVQVGLWNEFGTETSPERSWMRSAVDENQSLLNQWREEALSKVMTGEWNARKALEAIGFRIQVLLQNKIKSNVPPPNAPSTVEAKKRAGVPPVTLIDSGLMLRSVTYRVHLGGE